MSTIIRNDVNVNVGFSIRRYPYDIVSNKFCESIINRPGVKHYLLVKKDDHLFKIQVIFITLAGVV